jgi:NAD(P)H-hydrate repair Nnr-like enzyme with NAD(P)H-hydrate epimerase domain
VQEIQEKTASNAAYPRKFMENAAMQVHNFVQEQYPVKWYNFLSMTPKPCGKLHILTASES